MEKWVESSSVSKEDVDFMLTHGGGLVEANAAMLARRTARWREWVTATLNELVQREADKRALEGRE